MPEISWWGITSIETYGYIRCNWHRRDHRWALRPISPISDIGLSLLSEPPISDWRKREVWHYIGYHIGMNFHPISDIPIFMYQHSGWVEMSSAVYPRASRSILADVYLFICFDIGYVDQNGLGCRYRNSSSDIGMTVFSPTCFLPISEWQMSMSDLEYRWH